MIIDVISALILIYDVIWDFEVNENGKQSVEYNDMSNVCTLGFVNSLFGIVPFRIGPLQLFRFIFASFLGRISSPS